MYVGEGGGFYLEVVCTHTALWTYVVWSNVHTNEWLCVEVEEGVCVPFAVHANLTLNVCEGTCSLLA